jgi:hypothetical protein
MVARMRRPITLFTGQWADLTLAALAEDAALFVEDCGDTSRTCTSRTRGGALPGGAEAASQ